MGLFDGKHSKTVEELLTAQVMDLQAKVIASEELRQAERARHEKKEEEFFATQQDLIHTIMLLKGIPIREIDDNGNAVEVKAVPSVQRRTWSQIIAGKELVARDRAAEKRRQEFEVAKKRRAGVA